jgi:CRISPR-associated endoribonuclease Cas6
LRRFDGRRKVNGSLSLTRYRIAFAARETLDLPAYLGSTLRGAFGHAFRAIACPAPRDDRCPVPLQCPYHLIFESAPPPDSDALRTHDEVPRPFVIAPVTAGVNETAAAARTVFSPGEELCFDFTLIGRAQDYFPYFVVAFREVDRIGRGRRTVELKRVEALDPADGKVRLVYDAVDNVVRGCGRRLGFDDCVAELPSNGSITIEFLTQTRLKHEGRFVRTPEFQILFRRLLGRLSSLSRFHCGAPMEVDFRALIDRAASIRLLQDDTRWTRWQRYSSRQERRMEWEGIVGRATYEGDFAPFWKYLRFGQFVHVGHGATFGLGMYVISRGQWFSRAAFKMNC